MLWRLRASLCETCRDELLARRARWMADPGRDPTGLRAVRLAAGLSLRELSARDRNQLLDDRDGRAGRDQVVAPLR
jgi:hypothetical protein